MLKNYLKIAFKVFLRRKFFTFISLFAIGFTLVVLMVAVAFLDHVFGKQPPEMKLERTLGVYRVEMRGEGNRMSGPGGYRFFDRYMRDLPNVERLALSTEAEAAYSYHGGEKIQSYLKRTDGEFWKILEFEFLEGGPLTDDDERNANFVAVINQATRDKFFGGGSVLGQTIEVDAQRFRIVGVVANVPYLRQVPFADIWVPISTAKTDAYKSQLMGNFVGLILARSTADFPAIKEEFQSRLRQVEIPDPRTYGEVRSWAETFFEYFSRIWFGNRDGRNHPGLLLAALLTAMLLFMLLPTINLININVSRIMERASEIGVRKAFGASTWALVGQFVTENVLLTLIGGGVGFLGSWLVLGAITRSGWFPYAEFRMNHRIFFYGLAIAIFFGLFSGVYPAWKMSRLHPVQALKGGGR